MKKGKLRSYAVVSGLGEECPKCREKMERRKRIKKPETKTYFFTEWDYCPSCSHVQHYEQFKSVVWREEENTRSFFRSL